MLLSQLYMRKTGELIDSCTIMQQVKTQSVLGKIPEQNVFHACAFTVSSSTRGVNLISVRLQGGFRKRLLTFLQCLRQRTIADVFSSAFTSQIIGYFLKCCVYVFCVCLCVVCTHVLIGSRPLPRLPCSLTIWCLVTFRFYTCQLSS